MREKESSEIGNKKIKRILKKNLNIGIERGCRIVKKKDRRIEKKRE